jgi:hypothetical protein
MRNGLALAIGGALFALLFFSSASAPASVITSKGPRQSRASSYEGDAKRWTQARYDAAVAYLEKYWSGALSEDGIHDAALSVVAHWSLETGSGAAEYNFNVGNIHAVGTQAWFGSGDTGESGRAIDGRAGAAIEPPTLSRATQAFNLSTNADGTPSRWFQADCGDTIGRIAGTLGEFNSGRLRPCARLSSKSS